MLTPIRKAVSALSHADFNVEKHYRATRLLNSIAHPTLTKMYRMQDFMIPIADTELLVRLFEPHHKIDNGLVLFFHGGGWTIGNVNEYTAPCAALADHLGRQVASVDYRLAPEYPFPYAVEDSYQVARAVLCSELMGDYRNVPVTLCGDSAGGNIAAVISLMCHERHEFRVDSQILLYPATYNDHTANSPFASMRENGKDYLLTDKRINEYVSLYVTNEKERNDPHFAPYLSDDLFEQPRTLILTAELDPLRDEGEAYGEKLKKFGCEVEIHRIADAMHGFFSTPLSGNKIKQLYRYAHDFLMKGNEPNQTLE